MASNAISQRSRHFGKPFSAAKRSAVVVTPPTTRTPIIAPFVAAAIILFHARYLAWRFRWTDVALDTSALAARLRPIASIGRAPPIVVLTRPPPHVTRGEYCPAPGDIPARARNRADAHSAAPPAPLAHQCPELYCVSRFPAPIRPDTGASDCHPFPSGALPSGGRDAAHPSVRAPIHGDARSSSSSRRSRHTQQPGHIPGIRLLAVADRHRPACRSTASEQQRNRRAAALLPAWK